MKKTALEGKIKKWVEDHETTLKKIGLAAIIAALTASLWSGFDELKNHKTFETAKSELQSICNHYKCTPKEAEIHIQKALDELKNQKKYVPERISVLSTETEKTSRKLMKIAIQSEREHVEREQAKHGK